MERPPYVDAGVTTMSSFNRAMPLVIAWILILSFVWRIAVTAHEYQMRTEQVLTMLIDLGLMAGLIGMRDRVPAPLFWCAIVAGVGSFALRLTGDDGWWTGHLSFSVRSR